MNKHLCDDSGAWCRKDCAEGACVARQGQNPAMPKTVKERQEDFRARRALLEGAKEVRGIFLPEELHAELKAYARKLAKKGKPLEESESVRS